VVNIRSVECFITLAFRVSAPGLTDAVRSGGGLAECSTGGQLAANYGP